LSIYKPGGRKFEPEKGTWLWCLLALFGVRVVAQLIQQLAPVSFLPPFEAWHSAAMPYPLLLLSQLLIFALFGWIAWRISSGQAQPHHKLGRWLLGFGAVYMLVMFIRLTLGLTLFPGHHWFDKPLPTFFHLVLAAYLLVLGAFHIRLQGRKMN